MAERHLRFAIIGAGMAGILSAIKLTESGLTDFTVYEQGDRVGGTWRENSYPGLSCDVPSQLYCFSFAPNPDWTHPYSPGLEIQQYFERVAESYGVVDHARFNDEVVRCEWLDSRWHLTTHDGHTDVVDVVISATGVLHHPKWPDIAGLDSFEGRVFHSARWDHDAVLDDARVGIVGSGSTGVQIIAAIHERVAHLASFQRTPQWVMPMSNEAFVPQQLEAHRDLDYLRATHSKLGELFGRFTNAVIDAASPESHMIGEMCRSNLEANVTDPALRERLRPDYQAACKRLIISENYYQAMQHPNVELVTDEIANVESNGVRTADGVLHELDVLVLATGFHADWFMRPMQIVGTHGVTLDEAWAQRPLAYLSMTLPDFPNFFMLNGPNGPVGNFSLISVAELQFAYIEQLIARLRAGDALEIAPDRATTEQFEATRVEAAQRTVWMTGCTSWYLDDRGVPATWPWPWDRFLDVMAAPQWSAYNLTEL